jgi:hypothetical protein
MTGRRAMIGLSLLSALFVCALAAQSASAALTTSKRITAVTCAPEGGERDFKGAHCDPGDTVARNTGKFGHVEIKGETKEVDATNGKVTNETKESEPAVIKGEVALVKVEIDCNKVQNNLEKSFLRNSEPAAIQHTLDGTFITELSECTVTKPPKCKVTEPIIFESKIHAVEGLEGPRGTALEPNAMGLEFIGDGPEERLASIQFTGPECALKEKTFVLKGKMIATGGPTTESTQEDPESGSTLVFTPKFKMQELTLGGKVAEFTSIQTARMGRTGNPIATTTTLL